MNVDFLRIDTTGIRMNLVNLKQLVFEVTDGCNLQCKYCGYGELYEGYDDRKSQKLSFTKARLILNYLARLWTKPIGYSLVQSELEMKSNK